MSTEEPVVVTQSDNNNTNSESVAAAVAATNTKKEEEQQKTPTTPQAAASSLFGSVSSTFSSWTSSLQKETEQGFPGTFKRFNDFSQTIQAKAKELPQNIANLPNSFEAERNNFLNEYNNGTTTTTARTATKKNTRGSELVAPWQGYGAYEKEMKKRILALSKDQRNFLFSPPEDTSFQFDLKAYSQTAKAVLQHDEELARMRFLLVPQQVQEPIFWRNYFYRVTLEKQSVLSSTDIDPTQHEQEEEDEKNDVLFDYPTSDGEENEGKKDDQKTTKSTETKTSTTTTTTKEVENKSSSSPTPVKTEEPVKKMDENFEDMEEWERELRKGAIETA
ncbi:hypothetical protein BDC45DRAFT_516469 [Circinella umbellata]|nr:hypothetical protein BDC45DRAFT_516469 [Circinella umbellata]